MSITAVILINIMAVLCCAVGAVSSAMAVKSGDRSFIASVIVETLLFLINLALVIYNIGRVL